MTNSEIILYTTPKGDIKIEVFLQDETVWLTQRAMGELFGVETNTINYHLKEIFKSKELEENSVIRKIRITAADDKKYLTNFYNLDAIISMGYRVNSHQATQFRIWATKTLKEFIIKGFVLDDERLSKGKSFLEKTILMNLKYSECYKMKITNRTLTRKLNEYKENEPGNSSYYRRYKKLKL